ncbi:phage tail sheath family protein [Clostridium sp. AM58-1XD]|uniref:phage tail sheath family protein n=1 Tax=Clostridium sp. AM58-1XD TaxID=2292307 RepID=UPI000E49398B|nr:phage tail sheath family protein [Clostridium sp. AM58-1XD]RGY97267.1 phage tail sheath protein [Clostridium sp. AM58-1XD]
MMKGSDTTSGPAKILLYRLAGTGGEKASAVIGEMTATALYEGVRGNDLTIVVQESLNGAEGSYDISTLLNGVVQDEQNVTNIENLVDNDWVSFSGTGTAFTATAGTGLTGGKDPVIAAADYAAFLSAIEPYQFDIIAYDGEESTTIQAFAEFAKRMSNTIGHKCQAVMANAQESNSEFVISVNNGVKLSDGTVLTARQATWWMSGAQAGARYHDSLTYAQYPNAVEACPKLTDTEIEAAIQSGEIVFIDTFNTVKVCTDINTLTSFNGEKGAEFSKNRVVRVLNQFCNDVYEQFTLHYVGKTDNNDAGRNLLKGWIIGYLNEMQANGGIQNFAAEDVTVEPGTNVDSVVINAAIQPVDSIEKIYMTVTVSANAEE